MNIFKRKKTLMLAVCGVFLLALFAPALYSAVRLPAALTLHAGETFNVSANRALKLTASGNITVASNRDESLSDAARLSVKASDEGSGNVKLSLLGFIPLRSIQITVSPERRVMPGGQSIGVAMRTDGVLVVGSSGIETQSGNINPAGAAGLRAGDVIFAANGIKLTSGKQLADIVMKCAGNIVRLNVLRDNAELNLSVQPALDGEDETYRLGVWVRDSTAGVGTLSFYDAQSGIYGALGHVIADIDTGKTLRVRDGEIMLSSVTAIKAGEQGDPGEIKGSFLLDRRTIGSIQKNNEFGIYGWSTTYIQNPLYPDGLIIGSRSTVTTGPAKILTTLDENGIKEYDIEITKVFKQDNPAQKSMTIRITDPELLAKTGGIVQGMSGSPIIQNGNIIGAVTHVYVNDPSQGYGLYIEWMLRAAGILA